MTDVTNLSSSTLTEVKSVLVETLGLEHRADVIDGSTPLLGSLPELDSMAVAALIAALEDRFGIELDECDLTAEVFETLGSLSAFVQSARAFRR